MITELKKLNLTYNEINSIVNDCVNIESELERLFMMDMYLIKYTTNIDIPKDVNSAMWDKYRLDGTIDEIYKQVKDVVLVKELINKELSISNILKGFLESIDGKVDGVTKSLPKSVKGWNKLIDGVKDVIDNGK